MLFVLQRPWDKDRYMAPDIEEVTNLLLEDKIWGAVQHHITYYHAPEVNISPNKSKVLAWFTNVIQLC
jgi:hypothetical protein